MLGASRIDLMGADTLRDLKTAGLTSITVGVETPDEGTLRRHRRVPINSDRQIEFVRKCRELGIRTVVQFLIGFPEDTRHSIRRVLRYARQMNPTFANFNVVTPYPGTRFRQQVESQVGDYPYADYNSYTPVLNYQHLTREQVVELHSQCFEKYYFRSRYIKDNAHLLWPKLQMLGAGLRDDSRPTQAVGHQIEWTDESRVRRAA
jgi:anaerobic magnesium-protoporphyrin IX monomethyl ester cyclase